MKNWATSEALPLQGCWKTVTVASCSGNSGDKDDGCKEQHMVLTAAERGRLRMKYNNQLDRQ